MRKRSKYRPRPVLANPVAYVVESVTPVTKHGSSTRSSSVENPKTYIKTYTKFAS